MHAFCASVSSACRHSLSLSLSLSKPSLFIYIYIYMSTLSVSTSHPHLSETSIAISITVTDSTSLSQILFKIWFDLGQMAKICMNKACQATTTFQWKEGWGLKSGSAYENLLYCEMFHLEESGWRESRLCRERIHCGCIASKYLYDYLDFAGIGCVSCTKSLETRSIRPIQIPNNDISHGFGLFTANNIGHLQSSYVEHRMGGISLDKEKFTQLSKSMNANELSHCPQTQRGDTNASIEQIQREEIVFPNGEVRAGFPDLIRQSVGSSIFAIPKNNRPILGEKDMYKSLAQPSTSLIFSNPLETPYSLLPSLGGAVEGREQNKVPPVKQGKKTCLILPKPPKTGLTMGSDANRGMVSQTRVLRLPDEGRGCNQLLPRYWPRVTDDELQQISGDRIGHAYFPPISQSEGIPIKIQDIKGKEWTFQFRFWPNNKSCMYVLEGINPCIQNMELQAGDIVTFSRIDPGGKLVIAFRKASNFINLQDIPGLSNGAPSRKISTEYGGRTNEDSLQRPMLIPGKKRARNIGSKNKRLLMHGEDAMELRLTWEEAQELLRPPPSAKPTIVMIEDQEFQEYDPPVFGKSTVFTSRASGRHFPAMESVIGLVNRVQKACMVLGDYGADNALPTLWDSLPTIVAVAVTAVIVRSSPLSDCLCVALGSAYENLLYCETFHLEESGWRECRLCRKRIHCGCIASKYLYDYLDFGGIGCISCTKSLETRSIPNNDISHGFGPFTANNIGDLQSSDVENRMGGINLDKEKFTQLSKSINANELSHCPQTQRGDTNSSIGQIKREEIVFPNGEVRAGFSDLIPRSVGSSIFAIPKNNRPILGEKDMAYFPPISQSEGIPIKIQDIKGKEWTFQFRFWPNNKSRMYVLEGINPCIQNMELQAGDIG
ncbi:unnamed protein product [Camellia sinensis]